MKSYSRVHLLLYLITTIFIYLLLTTCGSQPDRPNCFVWLKKASAVGSWQRISLKRYQGEELYDIINGAATLYLDHGLTKGIQAVYNTKDKKECEIFIHEFAHQDSVKKMFDNQEENLSNLVTIDGYDPQFIKASPAIGATFIFGRNSQYYFELNVSGFQDRKSMVSSVAPFLQNLMEGSNLRVALVYI